MIISQIQVNLEAENSRCKITVGGSNVPQADGSVRELDRVTTLGMLQMAILSIGASGFDYTFDLDNGPKVDLPTKEQVRTLGRAV